MWIYPDSVLPDCHEGKVGDIVIITRTEFGMTDRQVGVVVRAEPSDWGEGAVDVMLLDADFDL